ncbi:MAG: YitT family protein [Clostridia bacterium]|nr:YitT family protein [Clostridia bacterium]
MKSSIFKKIRYWAMLNVGILMMAVGIYFFKATNNFATGGVSGLSVILAKLVPYLTQATYMLIVNVLLLLVGIIVLGRKCGLLTIFSSIMLSAETWLFEYFIPLNAPLTEYPLLELVYAVMLTGVGSAIVFKCNTSTGGTDIVALILKKFTSLNVGQALLVSDFIIAASTFFVYDVKTGLFSLLGLFAKVFVVDDILDSINMCKAFTIITTKPKEIEEYITKDLHHGATAYRAQGVYTGEDKTVIITVCHRMEALRLRKAVKAIDAHSFMIITKTSEIMGKGFRDNTV